MIIKSDFKDFLECPRKYALKTNHTPEDTPNFVLARRNELGVEVGRLAHQLFNGLKIIPHDVSLEERLSQTQKALLEDFPIAEASFIFEDAFCAIDILEKTQNGYIIHEVKSNTKIEKPMIEDVAYQTYIAQMSGLNIIQVNIVHVNKSYIKKESIDPQRYFKIVDVTDKVKTYVSKVPNVIRSIQTQEEVPSFIPVSACKDCPFKSNCFPPLPKDSMVHIYDYKQKTKMYLKGVRTLEDYRNYTHKLNDIQNRQIDFHYQDES
jgi:CRISPR/Cas system-associated exonuclease Cas4 (RecB family)